jgi:hypothetical protein
VLQSISPCLTMVRGGRCSFFVNKTNQEQTINIWDESRTWNGIKSLFSFCYLLLSVGISDRRTHSFSFSVPRLQFGHWVRVLVSPSVSQSVSYVQRLGVGDGLGVPFCYGRIYLGFCNGFSVGRLEDWRVIIWARDGLGCWMDGWMGGMGYGGMGWVRLGLTVCMYVWQVGVMDW